VEEKRIVERPLYSGLMYWEYEGKLRRLGTSWNTKGKQYAYHATAPEQYDDDRWRWATTFVDEAITNLLRAQLEETFKSDTWEETIAADSTKYQKERNRIEAQLTALERYMEAQIASLDVITEVP